MAYYPLATLMMAGIQDILIITTQVDETLFERLQGGGPQTYPGGLVQAFLDGADFVDGNSCVVLGDNIFYGNSPIQKLRSAAASESGAAVFAYLEHDTECYGIVEFDAEGRAVALEEKPAKPKENYAVTGLYFYDERVSQFAAALKPSANGEMKITELKRVYLEAGNLYVETLGRGHAWLDAGMHESLLQAAFYVQTVQERQGFMASCPEKIAFRIGWIGANDLIRLAEPVKKNGYGRYQMQLAAEGKA